MDSEVPQRSGRPKVVFYIYLLLLSSEFADGLDILAATQLERCVSTSSTSVSNCEKRLIITASISNAEEAGTGRFEYVLGDSAGNSVGQDPSGDAQMEVADTIAITMEQSAIRLVYPVRYVQDVNNEMREQVLYADRYSTGLDSVLNPCRDHPADSTAATCGWAISGSALVADSQGFCCSCPSLDQGIITLPDLVRPSLKCSAFSRPAAAHCPRLSPLWYSVYSIGEARMEMDIRMFVYVCRPKVKAATGNASSALLRCHEAGPACTCDLLNSDEANARVGLPSLGPSNPVRCFPLPGNPAGSCDIEFRLIGTYASYDAATSFASKYLLVPTLCDSGSSSMSTSDAALCRARLEVEGPAQFMVVEKSEVTLSGTECNKVGVGFQAFRGQGNACALTAGACLANQPQSLHAGGKHFLSQYKATTHDTQAFLPDLADGLLPADIQNFPRQGWSLSWSTRRFQATTFTLTVRAADDSLRLVITVSPGRIIAVQSPAFEAGQVGTLRLRIANTGSIASRYTVAFGCPLSPTALDAVSAVQLTLQAPHNTTGVGMSLPSSEAWVEFQLRTTSGGESLGPGFDSSGQLPGCQATLLNAQGVVTDRVNVSVTATPKQSVFGGQGGTGSGTTESGPAPNSTAKGSLCDQRCDSLYDLSCAVKAGTACTNRLLGWAGGAVGSLVVAGLLAKLALTMGLCSTGAGNPMFLALRVLASLCCCCRKNDETKIKDALEKRRNEKKRKRKEEARRDRARAREDSSSDSGSDSSDSESDSSGKSDGEEEGEKRRRGRRRGGQKNGGMEAEPCKPQQTEDISARSECSQTRVGRPTPMPSTLPSPTLQPVHPTRAAVRSVRQHGKVKMKALAATLPVAFPPRRAIFDPTPHEHVVSWNPLAATLTVTHGRRTQPVQPILGSAHSHVRSIYRHSASRQGRRSRHAIDMSATHGGFTSTPPYKQPQPVTVPVVQQCNECGGTRTSQQHGDDGSDRHQPHVVDSPQEADQDP